MKKLFQTIRSALTKTRSNLTDRIFALFNRPIDTQTQEQLEEILFEADLGSELTLEFLQTIRPLLRSSTSVDPKKVLDAMQEQAETWIRPIREKKISVPHVILVVGVNGSGKTTSCAKLAHHYKKMGRRVLLAAADTFRAAAIDQLASWAQRLDIPIVKGQPKADPAAVAFDAMEACKARGFDLVIIDTAGRLQSKTDLMRELEKMRRACHKWDKAAPHETLLAIDATTGQNGLDQARAFHAACPLSGIILTKLDGSAKGGIALSIMKQLPVPVVYVGVGEKEDDLDEFNSKAYLDALFSY